MYKYTINNGRPTCSNKNISATIEKTHWALFEGKVLNEQHTALHVFAIITIITYYSFECTSKFDGEILTGFVYSGQNELLQK